MRNQRIKQVEGIIIEKQEDGSAVLFDEVNGNVHLLNDIAFIIYELCMNDINENIMQGFIGLFDTANDEITKESIRNDFIESVDSMIAKGLIEYV